MSEHPKGRLGGVYALEDDHPLMLAMRLKDPKVIAVAYDFAYLVIVTEGERGQKQAERWVVPPKLRAALDAYERGEPFKPGASSYFRPA